MVLAQLSPGGRISAAPSGLSYVPRRPLALHYWRMIVPSHSEQNPTYSFVIPVYNEEEVLPELHRRMVAVMDTLDGSAEAILVDDGSRDNSYPLMLELNALDPRFKAVHFSRNFGKEVAVSAGLDLATGEAVVLLDADLQDPPELVVEMAARWREGYDMVYAKRDRRINETWFKRQSSRLFYRTLRRISDVDVPLDVGDSGWWTVTRSTHLGRCGSEIATCAGCSGG